jgi:hypothetical protein
MELPESAHQRALHHIVLVVDDLLAVRVGDRDFGAETVNKPAIRRASGHHNLPTLLKHPNSILSLLGYTPSARTFHAGGIFTHSVSTFVLLSHKPTKNGFDSETSATIPLRFGAESVTWRVSQQRRFASLSTTRIQ